MKLWWLKVRKMRRAPQSQTYRLLPWWNSDNHIVLLFTLSNAGVCFIILISWARNYCGLPVSFYLVDLFNERCIKALVSLYHRIQSPNILNIQYLYKVIDDFFCLSKCRAVSLMTVILAMLDIAEECYKFKTSLGKLPEFFLKAK